MKLFKKLINTLNMKRDPPVGGGTSLIGYSVMIQSFIQPIRRRIFGSLDSFMITLTVLGVFFSERSKSSVVALFGTVFPG